MPEISVITIVRDGGKYIKDAVESVLNQSFIDFEYIIIDDESKDDTLEILSSYDDDRIKVYSLSHDYVGNLNYALKLANGKFIARFDGDDFMHSNRLLIQHTRMLRNSDIDICATWGATITDTDFFNPIYSKSISRYITNPLVALIRENFIIHGSVMFRKSFLEQSQCEYRWVYPYCEDYDLWIQMAKKKAVFYLEPQVLVGIRRHQNQISSKKKELITQSSQKLRLESLKEVFVNQGGQQIADGLDTALEFAVDKGIDVDKFFRFYCDLVM